MTGAGERVASSSRWTASGCIDRSVRDDLASCATRTAAPRCARSPRRPPLVDSRRGEGERDRHTGAVLADRAVHEHRLIGEDAAHDVDDAVRGVVDESAVHLVERHVVREERRHRAEEERHALHLDLESVDAARRVGDLVVGAQIDDATDAESAERGESCVVEPGEIARSVEHAGAGAAGAGRQAADVAEVDGAGDHRTEVLIHQAAPDAASRSSPARSSRGGTL